MSYLKVIIKLIDIVHCFKLLGLCPGNGWI